MNSLKAMGTIVFIKRDQLLANRTSLTGKWVYKKKILSDASIKRYKAR